MKVKECKDQEAGYNQFAWTTIDPLKAKKWGAIAFFGYAVLVFLVKSNTTMTIAATMMAAIISVNAPIPFALSESGGEFVGCGEEEAVDTGSVAGM